MKPALNFQKWMVLLILEIYRNMIFMTVSLHPQSFQKAMTMFLAKHCCMGNLRSRSGTQKLRNRTPNVSQFDMLVEEFENFDRHHKRMPTLEKLFQAY